MTPPPSPSSADAVSPCVGVCRLDAASGRCEGCLRTIDEIAAWGGLDETARAAVRRALPERRRQRDALAPSSAADAAEVRPAAPKADPSP